MRNSGVSVGVSGRVRGLLVATVAASLLATACSSGHPRSTARSGATAPTSSQAADTRWTTTPGTAERRCVNVGRRSEVRSGSFIVGNFQAYAADWNGTRNRSKLYYIPLYPQGKPPLDVRAEALGGPAAPFVSVLQGYGEALGDPFAYTTGTVLPRRGEWRLIAIAGRNWGCFDFTL
jgi:hypothetical protein